MTSDKERGSEPGSTRFKKGQSGNPKGRPRGKANSDRNDPSTSAFDVIIGKTLAVTLNGVTREVTAEEALQWQVYQQAIKGDKAACREVLKMINRREEWLALNEKPKPRTIKFLHEIDPDNADEALLILEIATIDQKRQSDSRRARKYLLLEPWAAQAALDRRRGGRKLDAEEISDIRRSTRDAQTLRFPRGTGE